MAILLLILHDPAPTRALSAGLEVTGGIAYVPITFTGLSSYRGYELWQTIGGQTTRVDQSDHGRDFWQTDYDPVAGEWSITYNVLLDSPEDQPRTVRLLFQPVGGAAWSRHQ